MPLPLATSPPDCYGHSDRFLYRLCTTPECVEAERLTQPIPHLTMLLHFDSCCLHFEKTVLTQSLLGICSGKITFEGVFSSYLLPYSHRTVVTLPKEETKRYKTSHCLTPQGPPGWPEPRIFKVCLNSFVFGHR